MAFGGGVGEGVCLGLGAGRLRRRFRRCRRFRNALTGDGCGLGNGGRGLFGEGAEETALGVFEGEGGAFGEEGLDGLDDGLVLLVGAGVVGGEGEDGSAVLDAEGEALVLGENRHALVEGRLDKMGLGLGVAGVDKVLDEGGGPVGGDDGEGGPELRVEGGEDVGDLVLGDVGEAGDEGAALLEGDGDGCVGEGVGAEFLPGPHAIFGDDVHALDEGVEGGDDVLGDFLDGIGRAVEVGRLDVLWVFEGVVDLPLIEDGGGVFGVCEGAFDNFLDLCDSIVRRGKRSGAAGPSVALCDVDRP